MTEQNGNPNWGWQGNNNQGNQPGNNYGTGGASWQAGAQQPAQMFDAYGNPIPTDAKSMAVLTHLSGLLGLVFTATFASFIGPLIFWLVYKDRPGYAFVRVAAAGAFNFSFTMWIINIATWLITILSFGLAAFFTWIIFGLIWAALIVFHIIAAVKANNGEVYHYPMTIKILN